MIKINSNGIRDRQNSPKCLRMLAAQRQLYRDCKKFDCMTFFFNVLVPFLCAVTQMLFPANKITNICVCVLFILGFIIGILILGKIEKIQENAAKIQLLFDLEVFQLHWDLKLFGQKTNLNPLIVEKSEKILSKDEERELLINWYSVKYDEPILKKAILFCQRANIWWDGNIRKLYKTSIIVLIVIMILFILVGGSIKNYSLLLFLLRLLIVIPIAQWLIVKIRSISNDIRNLDIFKDLFLDETERNEEELLIIQSHIFNYRKNCTLIPDWFYKINRKEQEHIMNVTAEIEIDE